MTAQKAYISSLDITPDFEVALSGFTRMKKINNLHSQLEANILILEDEEPRKIIITFDTLFITQKLYDYIFTIFNSKFDNKFSINDLIICSSRTHYSPSLESARHDLGELDVKYFNFLKLNQWVDLMSWKKSFPYRIIISLAETENLTSNRRRSVRNIRKCFQKKVVKEPNTKGEKSETLYLFKIINSVQEDTKAVIGSYSCHPANLPEINAISSEYRSRSKIAKNQVGRFGNALFI